MASILGARHAARLLAAAAVAAAVSAASPSWTLTSNSAFYLDSSVPGGLAAITLALKDLSRDWYRVIGVPPITLPTLPSTTWAGDMIVTFALNASMSRESFTVTAGSAAGYNSLAVVGADTRGLIFGIYHVSSDFLGVDPMWYFNDVHPSFAGVIDVPPSYAYESGSPEYEFRVAFNNDEDLSGYFHADPAGDSVYAGEYASFFCEALLRLRVNTFIPSTFGYADERPYRIAQARGMALGNHHVMPMGNNVYAWPEGVAYSYRLNPEPFRLAWETLIQYEQVQQGREMVYSVGYRGINDEPFWNQDPLCVTDQCRGETISQAIANQTAIAIAAAAAANGPVPRFVSYAWMELQELKTAGTLVLPPNTSWVWTDFPGSFLFSAGFTNVTAGDSFYGHIQMMNGQAAQLTEFIPPSRIFGAVWQFWMRNATTYGVINLSDLRPVPLTAQAVYQYLWSPASFNATGSHHSCRGATAVERSAMSGGRRVGRRGPIGWWPIPTADSLAAAAAAGHECVTGGVTPAEAEATFVSDFMARHFTNTTLAAAAAANWEHYIQSGYLNNDKNIVADHYFGNQMRGLLGPFLSAVASNSHSSSSLASKAASMAAFGAEYAPYTADLFNNRVLPLASSVPSGAQAQFYASFITMQVAVHHFHLQAFVAAAAGAEAWLAGNTAAAIANVSIALQAFDELMGYLRAAESGPWTGVYAYDGWTYCWGTRASLAQLLCALQGTECAPAPPLVYTDYGIMTFECAQANSGSSCNTFPFKAFNASIAWDIMPRVVCAADVPGAGGNNPSCKTTFVGATYTGASAQIGMYQPMHPLRGADIGDIAIKYTTDGSTPSLSSPTYTGPITVSGNVTVTAQAVRVSTGELLLAPNAVTITQQA